MSDNNRPKWERMYGETPTPAPDLPYVPDSQPVHFKSRAGRARNQGKELTPELLAARVRHAVLVLRGLGRDINFALRVRDFPNIAEDQVKVDFLTDLKLLLKAAECRLVALQMLGEGLAPALTDLLPLDAEKV